MERLAGRLRTTPGAVRPYAPPLFAPEVVAETSSDASPAPPAARPAPMATFAVPSNEVAEPHPDVQAAPGARPAVASTDAPVVARYASSAPPPASLLPAVAPPSRPSPETSPVAGALAELAPADSRAGLLVPFAHHLADGAPAHTARVSGAPSADRKPPLDAQWLGGGPTSDAVPVEGAHGTSATHPAQSASVRTIGPSRGPASLSRPGAGAALHTDLAPPSLELAPPASVATSATPSRAAARTSPQVAPPTVHVTIGRVDVRAVVSAPAPRPSPPAPKPPLALEDYLRQRDRGER
jgi:hypothetical protein